MPKPFTIGIDASRANRTQRTGVEWYAYYVIQRLKAIVPPDVRVVLYTEEPLRDGLEQLPPNWEGRPLLWPPRKMWSQLRLAWEVLRRPPDVLFVPAYIPPALSALQFGPRRLLVTLHDPAFMTFPEAYSFLGRTWLHAFYRLSLWRGQALTVSAFSKSETVRLFNADPSRITVTPLAYDSARFFAAPEDAGRVAAALAAGEPPYFLFVGRLETKKNVAGLLTAFAHYKRARPHDPHRLTLVGKRGVGYEREMERFNDVLASFDAETAARVRAAIDERGYAAPEWMRPLISGATAFVFPSRYEGFGIPMLEAMACGTPVIASDRTSMPEVAGDAALLVNPDDAEEIASAMARLADDAAFAAALRAKGLARVKAFSWERTAAETWAVLDAMRAARSGETKEKPAA